MQIIALAIDPLDGAPHVIAQPHPEQPAFAIPVGLSDAPAIRAELLGIDLDRPLAHQLTVSLVQAAGASIDCVELVAIDGARVLASICVRAADGTISLHDGRASDAVALALCAKVPIWVAPHVIRDLSMRHLDPPLEWPDADLPDSRRDRMVASASKWRG